MAERFTIERGRWYTWTMYPGYFDTPYHSPIYVEEFESLGGRRLRLKFYNAAYMEGGSFELTLTTLARKAEFLVSDLGYYERVAVVGKISLAWMQLYFPELTRKHLTSDDSLQQELTTALLAGTSLVAPDEQPDEVQPVEAEPDVQPIELFLWDAMKTAIMQSEVQAMERLDAVLAVVGYEVTSDFTTMFLMNIATGEIAASVPAADLGI